MTTDTRLSQLNIWLSHLADKWSLNMASLAPASSDASFRRYFRVLSFTNNSFIVMDAPPSHEDTRPFIHIAQLMAKSGLNVPLILEENVAEGFLLLSDLGTKTYLSCLNQETAHQLYKDAMSALIRMQTSARDASIAVYDRSLLTRELMLFPEWYLTKHLGMTLSDTQTKDLNKVFESILQNNLAQPQVLVHRDYHSRNLMLTPANNPGILDFQDAVYGPITYDLASLLRDAYIEWEETEQLDWAIRYWEMARKAQLPVSNEFGEFYKDFEWMGLQRHLKVLGIFARLYHRDGKDAYLKDLPLVLKYTRKVAERYIELKPLVRLLDVAEGINRPDGLTF